MYIDARKFDYGKFNYPDTERLIERDREAARSAYRKWMEESVFAIVNRQWEIDDIGVVERVGSFIKLLKEAEFTYALGAYTSSIALVGVCAEDLCRFLAKTAGHDMDELSQYARISELVNLGALTLQASEQFHIVRQLRNDCLHFNDGFQQKDDAALKADALSAINTIKSVYATFVGVVDYRTVDATKFSQMIDTISKEASGSGPGALGVDASIARTRNLFANVFGLDMSMNSARPVYSTSIFKVMEIDGSSEPPELTLEDMVSRILVIVDLTAPELESIGDGNISEGDIITATLMSLPNKLELTGLWRLWSSPRKLT